MIVSYEIGDRYNFYHENFYNQVYPLTQVIDLSYPGHKQWLEEKFLKELKSGSTDRGYVFAVDPNYILDKDQYKYPAFNGKLVGCTLLKKSENKMCCLFLDKSCRGQHIASKVMEYSFAILGTDKPYITVAENNFEALQGVVKKYNFELTSVKDSVYRKGVKEYYYNER